MTSPEHWSRIEALIRKHDHRALADVMTALQPDDRAALIKPLTALARSLTTNETGAWVDGAILAIAGAGVLAGPSTLAPWLNRYGLSDGAPWSGPDSPEFRAERERQWQAWQARFGPPEPTRQGGMVLGDEEMFRDHFARTWSDIEPGNERHVVARILRVLESRRVDWLDDLATRLSNRLRPTDVSDFGPARLEFQLVEAIRRETGLVPSDGDGWLAHWIVSLREPNDLTAALAAEPRLADRVPRVFDVDSAVGVLGWNEGLRENLARLTRTNAIDRTQTLDACVARLQRGGRPGLVKAVLAVHELLAPTEDEVASRALDYLALLPDSLSVVASMAQRNLARIDDAGRLSRATMTAASEAALRRPEKKIVRAQLARMTNQVKQHPTRAASAVDEVTTVFAHAAVDLQRAGVEFVVRHLEAADDAVRQRVRTAAQVLPADLRQRLSELETDWLAPPEPARSALPAPPTRTRLEPIESRAELAEILLLIITRADPTTADWERVLEALVRYADDRPALNAALAPVTGHDFFEWLTRRDEWDSRADSCSGVSLLNALGELIGAALDHRRNDWVFRHCGHRTNPLDHVVVHRTLQLADAVRSRSTNTVLAFPTWTNGLIDVTDLVDRLETLAREGRQPELIDLDQALLRVDLMAPAGSATVERLASIGGTAAATLVEWLRTGPPEPPRYRAGAARRLRWSGDRQVPAGTFTSAITERPAQEVTNWVWSTATAPQPAEDVFGADGLDLWPAVLPMHREAPAAAVAALLARDPNLRMRVPALPALAETNGAPGDGFLLAMAYAMAGRTAAPRMDAVDACLVLTAREQLDGTAFGDVLGTLVVRGDIVVGRVVPSLREAAEAGAGEQLWTALATALGAILTSAELPSSGMADLLALAAELAERSTARTTVDGLDEFAARPGRSRQLVEARRLAALLRRDAVPAP